MMILMIGALVTIVLGCAIVLRLRTFNSIRDADTPPLDSADLCYRPMQRLLDPAELQYLLDQGISKEKVNKLRGQRRQIYRLYLRSLAEEFKNVNGALKSLLGSSYSDRPDLATLLAKQQFTFYRNLLLVQLRLTLHACEFDKMPEIDLLGPLEIIQAQLRQLAPANTPAGSAV